MSATNTPRTSRLSRDLAASALRDYASRPPEPAPQACACPACERRAQLPANMPTALQDMVVRKAALDAHWEDIEADYREAMERWEDACDDLARRRVALNRDAALRPWIAETLRRYTTPDGEDGRRSFIADTPDWVHDLLPDVWDVQE